MTLFNTTVLLGLVLSQSTSKSPLLTVSDRSFTPSFSLSSFHLNQFLATAVFIRSQTNLRVEKSIFSSFLQTPFISARPPVENVNYTFRLRLPVQLTEFNEVTFQTCSTNHAFEQEDSYNQDYMVSGGAIFYNSSGLTFTVQQCNFLYCHSGRNGGALYVAESDTVLIKYTYFQNCDTGFTMRPDLMTSSYGGAVYCIKSRTLNISGCNFTSCLINYDNNIPKYGGAVFAETGTFDCLFSSFFYCRLATSNAGNQHKGGAIYVNCTGLNSNCRLLYSNFTECRSSQYGSAVAFENNIVYFETNYTSFVNCFDSVMIYLNPSGPSVTRINQTMIKGDINTHFFNGTDRTQYYSVLPAVAGLIYTPSNYLLQNKTYPPMTLNNFNQRVGELIYPYKIPLDDSQMYQTFTITPSASQSHSPTASQSPTASLSPTPTVSMSPSLSPVPSASPVIPEATPPLSSTPVSSRLSSVAIAFIVIAVIIVVVAVIVVSVICLRNGNCMRQSPLDQIAQPDRIKKTVYF
ncbi:hypothetical protein TRFO_25277 [Tritrichomonas foetus]|uniref:Right handed beta helix domain-containing protein n=1 Tax=Tritrichomonas foetus TaxID=1144522 RepID=A0A1J4K584_9EUKA|nr:hypothetical protein TRFO_25277 [Tritrichomonas foetus]|eukprot:OHT06609.1 hypothetical protein TRFO_25277 [Tritrichomonas foetus]